MTRLSCVLVAVVVWLSIGAAHANPISLEVLRGRQVQDTTHVQLSYAVDGKTPATPSETKRDDTLVAGSWAGLSGAYTANTGSGLKSVSATQLCDCNVPAGSHTYKVKVKSAMNGADTTLEVTVTVGTNPAPKDAGVRDLAPWEIPEPTAIQGIDCKVACVTKRDAAPVTLDGATKPKESGGCSLAAGGIGRSALALLLGLGLLAVALRRRL